MHRKSLPTSSEDKSPSLADTPLDIDLSTTLTSDQDECFDTYERSSYGKRSKNKAYEFLVEDVQPIPYCPYCGSRLISRIHRGFIRKFLLKSPPLYKCRECRKKFDSDQICTNENPGNQ